MSKTNGKIYRKDSVFQTIALICACVYCCTLYIGYVSPVLLLLHSLSLYALLGMSLVVVVIKGRLYMNKYLFWYAGFILIAMLSACYAQRVSVVMNSVYGLVIVFGIAFALSVCFTETEKMELFMKFLIIGSVVLMAYMAYTGQLDTEGEASGRLGGNITGNANTFASMYMIAACASDYFMVRTEKVKWRIVYIAAFVLQMYALMLSGGRKFFVVPIIVLYVMMLFKTDRQGKKHIIVTSILGAVILVALYNLLMNVPLLYESIGHRFEDLIDLSQGNTKIDDGSALERLRMREKAYELWQESPIVGHGLNMFAEIGGFGVYSHCNYFELLCNHGIIGCVYYYSFYVYMLYSLIKMKSKSIMKLFFLGVLIGYTIYDYGAVSYYSPIPQYYIVMAAIFINNHSKKSVESR